MAGIENMSNRLDTILATDEVKETGDKLDKQALGNKIKGKRIDFKKHLEKKDSPANMTSDQLQQYCLQKDDAKTNAYLEYRGYVPPKPPDFASA